MTEDEENKKREKEYDDAFSVLKSELKKERHVKLTGNVEEDFPELLEDEVEFDDETKDYIKKSLIEEVVDNAEVGKDNTITDKRLKRSIWKKIGDALFD